MNDAEIMLCGASGTRAVRDYTTEGELQNDDGLLFGIIGAAGCGKSTVARELVDGHRFTRKPFAYRLKAMLSQLGVPEGVLDGNALSKSIPLKCLDYASTRHAMQTLGTEWGRNCMGEDFWVNLWRAEYKTLLRGARVVADDVRFPNEVSAVRALGGFVIKVVRDDIDVGVPAHASEAADTLKHDFIIRNNHGLDVLAREVNALVVLAKGLKDARAWTQV